MQFKRQSQLETHQATDLLTILPATIRLVDTPIVELALAQQHVACVAPGSVIQEMKYNFDSVA